MLDGILKSAFYARCKSLIKMIFTRIDVIKRKRNATVKFLRKDIADLLSNGLDVNAYGRADGLLLEVDLLYGYDFIETSCQFVKKQLSLMDKQSECPEECRENVSSLMFAAARFSDLPELRELRQIFQERYGNSLDYYANKEFTEILASKSYTMERKVNLMKEIASEFSINWNSRAFERRMSTPPSQGQLKPYRTLDTANDRYRARNRKNSDVKGDKCDGSYGNIGRKIDVATHTHDLSNCEDKKFSNRNEFKPRQKIVDDDCNAPNGQKEGSLEKDGPGVSYRRRKGCTVNKQEVLNGTEAVRSNSSPRDKILEPAHGGYNLYRKGESIIPVKDSKANLPHGERLERDDPGVPFRSRRGYIVNRQEALNGNETTALKADRPCSSPRDKIPEPDHGGYKLYHKRENTIPVKDSEANLPRGERKRDTRYSEHMSECDGKESASSDYSKGGQCDIVDSMKKLQEEEMNKYCHKPYVKPDIKVKDPKYEANLGSLPVGSECTRVPEALSTAKRSNAANKLEGLQLDHFDQETQSTDYLAVNDCGQEKDHHHHFELSSDPRAKPRSHRTRRSNPQSRRDEPDAREDIGVAEEANSIRKHESRHGLQPILHDGSSRQIDEEERILDRLLIHYSKKPPNIEPEMVKRKSRTHHAHQAGIDAGQLQHSKSRDRPHRQLEDAGQLQHSKSRDRPHRLLEDAGQLQHGRSKDRPHRQLEDAGQLQHGRSKDRPHRQLETVPQPGRSVSLPNEQAAPSEANKNIGRAASFQPNGPSPARHVHPKLPDYDDLAARFAAFKAK